MVKIYIADAMELKDEQRYQGLYNGLDIARRQKTDRLLFAKDQRLSVAAGALLTYALRQEQIFTPTIDVMPNGKPYLTGEEGVYFNLSHSEERVMCAVSDQEVGCDSANKMLCSEVGNEEIRQMKKYNYIDLTRTMTMFGVMLCHILLFFSNNPFWYIYADEENAIAIYLCAVLDVTVVPVFVFCSGFLFQLSLQKKTISIPANLMKRTKRLLLPFFVYGCLWLVPTYTLLDIPTSGRPKGTSVIDGYQAMLLGQFCDVSWFLLMLFWVTVIWIFLQKLLKKERFLLGVIAAFLSYFAAHFLLADISFYKLNQIDIYLIIFFAGASLYWIADKVNQWSCLVLLLLSVAGVAFCAILAPYSSNLYWLHCVLAVIMPVSIVIFAMGSCKLKAVCAIENTKIYQWLLKYNLELYLLQAPGMYISFGWIYPLLRHNFALSVILILAVTILLDVICVTLLTYIRTILSHIMQTASIRRQ